MVAPPNADHSLYRRHVLAKVLYRLIRSATALEYQRDVDEALASLADGPSALPILGSGDPISQGLLAESAGFAPPATPSVNRVCIAIDEPVCASAARLLCRALGKHLLLCDINSWESALGASFRATDVASITIVLPAWGPTPGSLDAKPLLSAVRIARAWAGRHRHVPWGILTGVTPSDLTRSVAKAILQPSILPKFEAQPAAFFDQDGDSLAPMVPWWSDTSPSSLCYFHPNHSTIDDLHQHAFSLIVFSGHGRSYCACLGHLCSARGGELDPLAPIQSCILNMSCADPSFGRIDPRCYETPLMVLDVCGAGGLSSRFWDFHHPPLALLCAAAQASAIIASDGITQGDSAVDILWALIRASSLGDAVSLLNQCRHRGNVPLPYFLFGDPDMAAGVERWPTLATAIEATPDFPGRECNRFSAIVPAHATALLRLQLPQPKHIDTGDDKKACFVSLDRDATESITAVRWFTQLASQDEVWIATNPPLKESTSVTVQRSDLPRLPVGLATAADSIHERTIYWSSVITPAVPELLDAAAVIRRADADIRNAAGRAVRGTPADLELAVADAVQRWIYAQARCLEQSFQLLSQGLWPSALWSVGTFETREDGRPCPSCGQAPTIIRTYAVTAGQSRTWWECQRCQVVADSPEGVDLPDVRLDAPETHDWRHANTIRVHIDNQHGPSDLVGAGAALISHSGHGIVPAPRIFPAHVVAGSMECVPVDLISKGPPPTPHRYGLRVMLLLNGSWFWLGRPYEVLCASMSRPLD